MAQSISIVAQAAMDMYFQDFANTDSFWTLDDFITHCGNSAAAIYKAEYDLQKAQMRQDRIEAIVGFSSDWLSEFSFSVEDVGSVPQIVFDLPIMSFPFDSQNTGFQNLFLYFGNERVEIERTTINETWQSKFLPTTKAIFYYIMPKRIEFVNKTGLPLKGKKGNLLYVPGVGEDMEIPDGIADAVISNTVQKMKILAQGVVIDESNDQNKNKVFQTEMNPNSLKPAP